MSLIDVTYQLSSILANLAYSDLDKMTVNKLDQPIVNKWCPSTRDQAFSKKDWIRFIGQNEAAPEKPAVCCDVGHAVTKGFDRYSW